jgi:hypothetical protein
MSQLKTHYCGELYLTNGHRAAGWPVCKSGDGAYKVQRQGNLTREIDAVTCRRCLALYERRTNR